jgi:ATP/maltotriose-dependent transcriptional regulator MalT
VRESARAYLDVPTWRVSALAALGEIERRLGRLTAAGSRVRSALPDGAKTPIDNIYFVHSLGVQRLGARLALDEGKPEQALPWIAAHDHWRGEREAAQTAAEHALRSATEPRQPLALLAAYHVLGALALDAGKLDEAGDQLARALAIAEDCALPYERALIWLDQMHLLARQNRWEETLPLRKKTRATLQRLEAAPDLARLDALEARYAEGPPTVIPAGLSAREVEVLRLATLGLSYAEMGDRLYISPRTVARRLCLCQRDRGVDGLSAIGYQLSAISYRRLAFADSCRLAVLPPHD